MDSYNRVPYYTKCFFNLLSTHQFNFFPLQEINYINWKGKRSIRTFIPIWFFFGKTKYYSKPQWLLFSWDLEKSAFRTFAVKYFG